MAPVFGHRGIPNAAPPDDQMPLFAKKETTIEKELRRKFEKKRKQIGTGLVSRDAARRLVAQNEKLTIRLRDCESKQSNSEKVAKKAIKELPRNHAKVAKAAIKSPSPEALRELQGIIVETKDPGVSAALQSLERHVHLEVNGSSMLPDVRDLVAAQAEELAQTAEKKLPKRPRAKNRKCRKHKENGHLVKRVAKLQGELKKCRNGSALDRTSIVEMPNQVFQGTTDLRLEADYDDPREDDYILSHDERIDILADKHKADAKILHRELSGVETWLNESQDDSNDGDNRIASLENAANSLQSKLDGLVASMVRGAGETPYLRKQIDSLQTKINALRDRARRLRKFEEKKTTKAENLRQRANTMRVEANAIDAHDRRLAGVMAGTPIIVGHHSEGRHRNALKKMQSRSRKVVGLLQDADKLEQRAARAESDGAISSDDPDAVLKLKEKYRALEVQFPSLSGFRRTNARQELDRIRKRIESIRENRAKAGKEIAVGDVKATWNGEENRVQIKFPNVPTDEQRAWLKSHGFKWAPSQEAWQRKANESAWFWASAFMRDLQKQEGVE